MTSQDDAERRMTSLRSRITPDVAAHVLHHHGLPGGHLAGSFTMRLLDAWCHADPVNHRRLSQVFPAYGAAFELLGYGIHARFGPDYDGADELRRIIDEERGDVV